MSQHESRALDLAKQIEDKANELLNPMVRTMTIGRWPADYQAVMWHAIAAIATQRAKDAME